VDYAKAVEAKDGKLMITLKNRLNEARKKQKQNAA